MLFSILPLQLANIRNANLAGHVGFDSLPDQLVNKSVADGFFFNILCIGKFLTYFVTLLYYEHFNGFSILLQVTKRIC